MVGKLDTKKIDNIERPPDYRVESTVETHDEQRGGGQRQEEDEYSASSGVKGWQKFHTDAKDRKPVKIRTKDISNLFYNKAFLQKGLVILDVDIQLINGQILEHSHLLSTKIELYWKLKNLNQGQKVPVQEIIKQDYVEVSILHKGFTKRPGAGRQRTEAGGQVPEAAGRGTEAGGRNISEWSLWPLKNPATGRLNIFAITLYSSVIILLIIALLMAAL